MHKRTHIHIYTNTQIHMLLRRHMHADTSIFSYMNTYTKTYSHTQTHTHAHIQTHISTHKLYKCISHYCIDKFLKGLIILLALGLVISQD